MRFDKVLYAPNVHQGGGKTLLLPLLDALRHDTEMLFVLDRRLQAQGVAGFRHVMWVTPTVAGRLQAELRLAKRVSSRAVLVAMGNLPPLFARCRNIRVFLQNRYMIENRDMTGWPWKLHLRIALERLWFCARRRVVQEYIVQTDSMRRQLEQSGAGNVRVRPFFDMPKRVLLDHPEKKYDFLYVASGEPHKNHRFLVKGWCELAGQGHFPSLCLTLSRESFPQLVEWITGMADGYNLNITMDGVAAEGNIRALYEKSRALIYPSNFESLGLPLLEASVYGLPVVAADADYVHDVIMPSATFSTDREASLVDAVLQAPYEPAELRIKWLSPDEFAEETFRAES